MTFKIGIVGAPSSGKSVLACRLTAELMERGIHGARLVTEYAIEHLGMGNTIARLADQENISSRQISEERYASKCNFNPLICDSAIWIGKVYILHKAVKNTKQNQEFVDAYLEKMDKYKDQYDMTIFVPLFSKKAELNTFRIHDNTQAIDLDKIIREELKTIKNVMKAPKLLKDREAFIKYISGEIIETIT